MSKPQHIGVIGGGMAGLTAALRFAQAGHRVTLWERAPQFGGQAIAFAVPGGQIERYYHHLFQSDKDIIALCEELGIGDQLLWLPSNVGYFADNRIWPLNGAVDVLKLGFIPFIDRLRLGLVTLYLQMQKNWKPYESVTADSWLRRALGGRGYERTLGAQLRAKFGRHYDRIAMVWFWGKIRLRTTSRRSPFEQEKLGYPKDSFSAIIDALVAAARSAGATLISGDGPRAITQREDGRWTIELEAGDEICDAVVATVPSPIFQRLVPELPAAYAAKLGGLEYEAAVVVLLQLSRPLTSMYWLNIADSGIPFTGVIEHTNFMPPDSYNGKHYVYLSKYLEADHPYFSMDDETLIAEYLPYLQRLNQAFRRDWIEDSWVFRERAAQPIIPLHYSSRIPDHRTGLPGLYLANTTQIYPEDRGTNYSVRLGNDISRLVLNDLDQQ